MAQVITGLWIPIELLEDRQLILNDKVVLSAIYALDDKEQGCFASNKYLSQLIGITQRSVSAIISKLKREGYIKVEIENGYKRTIKYLGKSKDNSNQTPEEPNEQTETEKPESNSNQTPEQPKKQTDTYNTPSDKKPTKNIPKTNENQTLIETQTKLKLTAKEAQIVSKWGDVDKLKRAIKIYNKKNGKKFFGYLKAIYEKGAIDFSSMDKPRTQVTETAKEVAITTDDNVIVLSNREMIVGTETVTQLEFDLGEDVTEQVLDLIKKEQMVSPIAYDIWFKKSSFKRIANGLHITTSESGLEILKTRYTEVLEIVLKILEDGG